MGVSIFFQRALSFLETFFSLFQQVGILIFFLIFCILPAQAVKVQFPDEELASESVLPLIEPPQMVLNRNIPLKFRVELGAGMGFGLDEVFYSPFYPSGILVFNLSEIHALSVTGTYFFPKRSRDGEALNQGEGLGAGQTFDPLKAPYPQMSVFMNYQYTPYYGKISLAKNWVMNLSIYGFAGLGLVVSDQNDQWPSGNFGIGQKLYFNKWLGIRGDLGFYGYYGPAIAKLNLSRDVEKLKYKQLKAEKKRLILNIVANVGLIFLI